MQQCLQHAAKLGRFVGWQVKLWAQYCEYHVLGEGGREGTSSLTPSLRQLPSVYCSPVVFASDDDSSSLPCLHVGYLLFLWCVCDPALPVCTYVIHTLGS